MRHIKQGVLQDGNGHRIASATVSVYLADTTTAASIYTASSGGAAVNSVTTGTDGSWEFYVDDADYTGTQLFDITMAKAGYISTTLEDVSVIPYPVLVGLTVQDTTTRSKQLTVDLASATTAKTVTVKSAHTDNRTHAFSDQTDLVVGAVHGGDETKTVKFTSSGATTGKTLNLISSHTDDRSWTIPDATDTFVGKDTADTLTNKTLTSPVINTGVSGTAFLDEDNMASNSATKVCSQQSIKAYVDAHGLVGQAYQTVTATATGTTQMVLDDSIPQITEGDQYLTVNYTATSATNLLRIHVKALVSNGTTGTVMGAIFDGGADALATSVTNPGAGGIDEMTIEHWKVAGSTSAKTYTFRMGATGAGTSRLNGQSGRLFGGSANSMISVSEYKV